MNKSLIGEAIGEFDVKVKVISDVSQGIYLDAIFDCEFFRKISDRSFVLRIPERPAACRFG